MGTPQEWDSHVSKLGGNFYQTFGWGEVKSSSGWMPLRMVARSSGQITALASVLVKRRFLVGICWIPGGLIGPLCYFGQPFKHSLSALLGLKLIYCRCNFLQPIEHTASWELSQHGWRKPKALLTSQLTLHYSLCPDESDRISLASGNWRHNLKRSQRAGLVIEPWSFPDSDAISKLYREMEALKKLPVQFTCKELQRIYSCCATDVVTYRCLDSDGNILAVRAAGRCGENAIDLLAVAGREARKVYATHATLWAVFNGCRLLGVRNYDLGGIEPVTNPGVYNFKHGTGATIVHNLGEWEWSSHSSLGATVNYLYSFKRRLMRLAKLGPQEGGG